MTDAPAPKLVSSSADAEARARAQKLCGEVLSKRYRVDDVLALGGMGIVYRGEHMLMHKRIAIKVLHREIEGLPDLVKRFEREAVAGAHIAHPNVASATDFGELDDGSYFLVLEYVRGVTLFDIVRRGAMAPARAANIARQLACALEACHQTGIIHRDVKPKNVMVVEEQSDLTKLIDFGLARVKVERLSTLTAEEDARRSLEEGRLTGVGMIFGTIAYLAPEAALGMDVIDARSDLYALGLLFYEMLTGKHPFDATDPIELFKLQRTGRIPPFAERAPDAPVPAELEALVMRLLEKDPAARFQTGQELADAIDAAIAGAGLPRLLTTRPTSLVSAVESTSSSGTLIAASVPSFSPDGEGAADAGAASSSATSSGSPAVDRWSPTGERSQTAAFDWQPKPPESRTRRPTQQYVVVAGIMCLVVLALVKLATRSRPDPTSEPVARAATRVESAVVHEPAPATAAAPPPTSAPAPAAVEPSAAASSEPAATARTVDLDFDVPATQATLVRATQGRDWAAADAAFTALAANAPPSAFHDGAVALAMRELVVALDREGRADAMFEALAQRLGAEGVDVLYDVVQSRGGSKAAERAALALREPAVLAKASPEVRIAFQLREAPCDEKTALLGRAVKEGDGRALAVLKGLGASCLRRNKALGQAIIDLTLKVAKTEPASASAAPAAPAPPPAATHRPHARPKR